VDAVNLIYLKETIEELSEVVVSASKNRAKRSAKEIVRLALEKIPQNFPFKPFSYVGYYRDYQLKDGTYLNLNEAVLAVFDKGFGFEDLKSTRVRIYRYKENPDFLRDALAAKPYDYVNRSKIITHATLDGQGGNEYTILRLHNAIRNYNINTYSFVNRLDQDFIENHKLSRQEDTYLDDNPIYVIKASYVQDNATVIGRMYINKGNFALHKMEYAVYEKGSTSKYLEEQRAKLNLSEKPKKQLGKLLYEIIVEYQAIDDKMYLNYISFNNAFEVQEPPKFKPTSAKTNIEKKCFELVFNNPPLAEDAVKKGKYKLYYQGRKLKLDRVEVKKNKVLLYPSNQKVIFNTQLIQLLKERTTKGVAIEVKDVRDIYGNTVHKSEAVSHNQFREFFVQELKLNDRGPQDHLYMIKTRPIYSGQPIVAPKNATDYWMNTPLKRE